MAMSSLVSAARKRGALGVFAAVLVLLACAPGWSAGRDLLDDFWERSMQDEATAGSAVLRVDVDLDGDGHREVLLSNAALADRHGLGGWEVYRYVDGNQYRWIGVLVLSHTSFRVQQPGRVEAIWFGAADEDEGGGIARTADLVTYRVGAAAITQDSRQPLRESAIQDTLEQMDAWRKAVKLRPLVARVDGDGRFVNPMWTDAETGKVASDVVRLEGLVVVQ